MLLSYIATSAVIVNLDCAIIWPELISEEFFLAESMKSSPILKLRPKHKLYPNKTIDKMLIL